ncbi:MAG TPA: M13 family metallopeptidase [Terriglobales bacterium]|nr:M13 family metallopeptidase [Terriglobales bacterium]
MRSRFLLFTTVIFALGASAQNGARSEQSAPSGKPATESTPVQRPKSFDLDAIDKGVDPCSDFYEYACGTWRKKNPIPADQSRWGRFNELAEYNRQVLHDILEKASANDSGRSPVLQKIGDFYESCMNEQVVNTKGLEPLKPALARIDAVKKRSDLSAAVAFLHSQGIEALFRFGSQPDMHDASMEVATLIQGGLGLPDRDYYVAQDAKSQETREKYLAHMTRIFVMLGDDEATAKKEADNVMAIETKLAQGSFERVKMRDPKSRDHKMKLSDLASLAPNFGFTPFFTDTGAPKFSEINVAPPDFFKAANEVLASAPISEWKSYLRWQALHADAPLLSDPFVQEDFSFFGRYLSGQQELQPRWKRCVQLTDRQLGEALGQLYVQETFGAEGKERTLNLVNALEKALGADIQDLSWMTPDTKKQAAIKLNAITNKIGYPDKWRDYSTVNIVRDDLLGNTERARAFEEHRDLNKIGKPVDKSEWVMTPPTVNAYYQAAENDINFPAGILQPPFYDQEQDAAVNFGGIGVVIGHELTHGFDDQGSKFDAEGNLRNWWTDKDRLEFEQRTGCIADEYSSFTAVDDVHLNGRLTLGENTADNGGVRVALMALNAERANNPSGKENQVIEGFTPEQRFFLGYAQIWCENRSPESSRLLAKTDPHSPGRYRVNGVLQNNPDFARTFNCKAGQPMVRQNACRVW